MSVRQTQRLCRGLRGLLHRLVQALQTCSRCTSSSACCSCARRSWSCCLSRPPSSSSCRLVRSCSAAYRQANSGSEGQHSVSSTQAACYCLTLCSSNLLPGCATLWSGKSASLRSKQHNRWQRPQFGGFAQQGVESMENRCSVMHYRNVPAA